MTTHLSEGGVYRLPDGRHAVAFPIEDEDVKADFGLAWVLYTREEWPIEEVADLIAFEDGAIESLFGPAVDWHVADLEPTGRMLSERDPWPADID